MSDYLDITENFLTKCECVDLINLARTKISPAKVTALHGEEESDLRPNNFKAYFKSSNPEIKTLIQKSIKQFQISPDKLEFINITCTKPGGFFGSHVDYFSKEQLLVQDFFGGQREKVILIYLNEVKSGGETFFLGRKIKPTVGKAVVLNSLQPNGEGNPNTVHRASRVNEGEKWVVTIHCRQKRSLFSHPLFPPSNFFRALAFRKPVFYIIRFFNEKIRRMKL